MIVSLIQKADNEITLIDGYVDVGTLNLLSKKKSDVAATIYTQKHTKLTKTDVRNFNAQYPTLKIKYTKAFHDRFLILDQTTAYHVGASLKDAGKKCFGINLIEDAGIIEDILQRLELLNALTGDIRFEDAYRSLKGDENLKRITKDDEYRRKLCRELLVSDDK